MDASDSAPPRVSRAGALALAVSAIATLAALVASALLVVDYLRPGSALCGAGGGCDYLKTTSFAAWANVPTPIIGLTGFAVLGVLLLARGARARVVHLVVAAVAAVFAAFLLAVQIRLQKFCPFCITVDVSALVLSGATFLRKREEADVKGIAMPIGFVVAMIAAAVVPLAVGFTRPLPVDPHGPVVVPEIVKREMAASPPGVITIVDFADFECPFCRATHVELVPVLERHGARVRVVRKHVPLKSIHPGAMPAAIAACCGEQLGKREEMAEALFSAPVDELTTEGCERIATSLGLDVTKFRACAADPATTARVERDTADFRAGGGRGLPTIWIDDQRLVGAQNAASLELAIQNALKKRG